MPSATTSSLRAGCVALFVLGLVDLGVLNLYLAPAAFPPSEQRVERLEQPAVAQTPSQPGGVPQPGTPPSTPPPAETPPAKVAPAPPVQGGGARDGEQAVAGGDEGAGAAQAPAPLPLPQKTTILFGTAEYQLSAGAKRRLDRLAEALARATTRTGIRLQGHADKRGESSFNIALSHKRAQIVADYLAEQGVARRKLSVEGLGDQFPVTQGETPAALARNRRVEIIIQGER